MERKQKPLNLGLELDYEMPINNFQTNRNDN